MSVLLYDRAGFRTGRRLGDFLGIRRARSYEDEWGRADVLVRYGTHQRVPYVPSDRTVNRRRMLARQSGRLDQLDRLDSAGIPVPRTFEGGYPLGEPILGRSNGGMQGRGITHYPNPADGTVDDDHDFYMEYIDKDRQFRVHVIGGETRTRELVPTEGENREQAVWNYDAGFTFRVTDHIPHPVVPTAFAAVKALWLEFGAVDIVTVDGEPTVLEVNTAPGLCDPMLEWYAENLNRQYLHIEDIPGWDGAERRDEE